MAWRLVVVQELDGILDTLDTLDKVGKLEPVVVEVVE